MIGVFIMNEIILELESEVTKLEMINSTLNALDIAMTDGYSVLGPNTFTIPCGALKETTEKIVVLVNALLCSRKEKK